MPSKRVPATCAYCGSAFLARADKIKRGLGRYCSHSCSRRASSTDAVARFWSKVNKDGPVPAHRPELGPCWLWTGSVFAESGYGQFWYETQNIGAHRYAFLLAHGYLPEQANHHCDNPPCVRDSHLFEGSQAANMADMAAKGRAASGDRNGQRLYPERRARGDRHGRRLHPERWKKEG